MLEHLLLSFLAATLGVASCDFRLGRRPLALVHWRQQKLVRNPPCTTQTANFVPLASRHNGFAILSLPCTTQIPNFVSWAYLKCNELAPDHGKRMFYTDPMTGETVPDSDDEDDVSSATEDEHH